MRNKTQLQLTACAWTIATLAAVVVTAADDAQNGPFKSVAAIREEVESLKKQDVAWRKVPWKTCLLEGLRESQRTNKPILLWVFIDRPIDDERC